MEKKSQPRQQPEPSSAATILMFKTRKMKKKKEGTLHQYRTLYAAHFGVSSSEAYEGCNVNHGIWRPAANKLMCTFGRISQ